MGLDYLKGLVETCVVFSNHAFTTGIPYFIQFHDHDAALNVASSISSDFQYKSKNLETLMDGVYALFDEYTSDRSKAIFLTKSLVDSNGNKNISYMFIDIDLISREIRSEECMVDPIITIQPVLRTCES